MIGNVISLNMHLRMSNHLSSYILHNLMSILATKQCSIVASEWTCNTHKH